MRITSRSQQIYHQLLYVIVYPAMCKNKKAKRKQQTALVIGHKLSHYTTDKVYQQSDHENNQMGHTLKLFARTIY